MTNNSTGAPAPIFQAPIPPEIIIPSSDLGGPIKSIFDEAFADEAFFPGEDGMPDGVMDAIDAITALGNRLVRYSTSDAHAILFPGQIFASPRSPERWVQVLDQVMADLALCRQRMAREVTGS